MTSATPTFYDDALAASLRDLPISGVLAWAGARHLNNNAGALWDFRGKTIQVKPDDRAFIIVDAGKGGFGALDIMAINEPAIGFNARMAALAAAQFDIRALAVAHAPKFPMPDQGPYDILDMATWGPLRPASLEAIKAAGVYLDPRRNLVCPMKSSEGMVSGSEIIGTQLKPFYCMGWESDRRRSFFSLGTGPVLLVWRGDEALQCPHSGYKVVSLAESADFSATRKAVLKALCGNAEITVACGKHTAAVVVALASCGIVAKALEASGASA